MDENNNLNVTETPVTNETPVAPTPVETTPVAPAVETPVAAPVVNEAPVAPAPEVAPTPVEPAPVNPTPVNPTPVVSSPTVAPAPEAPKKKSNALVVILLVLVLLGVVCYGLYTYTDIFKGKNKTEDNTTTTTTAVSVYDTVLFEEDENVYAKKSFLSRDGKLYLLLKDEYKTLLSGEEVDINGDKAVLYKENIKAFYDMPFSNGGLKDYIYVDNDGDAFVINLRIETTMKPLEVTKVEGVSNIAKVVSVTTEDAWAYYYLNGDNQIVGNTDKILYDLKNKIGTNKLVNGDLYELTFDKVTDSEDGTSYTIEFSVTYNGNKVPVELTRTYNKELVAYNDLELVEFNISELS